MPIYEYRCTSCGNTVEVFAQTAGAIEPPATCGCGRQGTFSRLYSVFAAASANPGGSEPSECCGGQGECGEHACACGHGHDLSD
jgi:putative FmdB family regulatory protein